MAHIVTDRVLETTTTTGTGAIALGGAVSQFQDFDSQMANADTTAYFIKGISGSALTEWEVGLGTWNTGNTLTRTTVVRSSNSNAAVNFSAGTKLIGMTFTPTVRQPGMTFTGALTPATNDLAALGSASLSWADLFLAQNGNINWANGEVILGGGSDQLTVTGAVLVGAAGTTTYPPFNVTPGTVMTTPTAGAFESDATNFYGTTDAGNRGVVPIIHYIRADSNRTYTSNTSAQTIFNSPANGRVTLETGVYAFEGSFIFTSMSATSGNRSIDLIGAGTATVSSYIWHAIGLDGSTNTAGAASTTYVTNNVGPASIVTATIATTMGVSIRGSFKVTGAGTMIPSTTMVTAAASSLGAGSYYRLQRIGSTSMTFVGQWD